MMSEKTETRIAQHLLHHKEHGYSVSYILRKSATRYAILLATWVLCVLMNRYGLLVGSGLIFVSGLIVGAITRDVGWVRQGKKIWPLYVKVLDWAKVSDIAQKRSANKNSLASLAPASSADSSAHEC